jgi:hypothetical protein
MTTRLAVLLALALSPAAATAAPVTDQDADAAARRTTPAGQNKEFIYDDEEIDGDSLHPDHQSVNARPPSKHHSLIHIREHFIPQLLSMATDI